jgi:hypothetical protein
MRLAVAVAVEQLAVREAQVLGVWVAVTVQVQHQ